MCIFIYIYIYTHTHTHTHTHIYMNCIQTPCRPNKTHLQACSSGCGLCYKAPAKSSRIIPTGRFCLCVAP